MRWRLRPQDTQLRGPHGRARSARLALPLLGLGLLALSLACFDEDAVQFVAATPAATSQTSASGPSTPARTPALEVQDIAGWINSEPLAIASELAKGRVVLVDFWTYTCVNCIRTLPFLEAWHERYSEHGLTVIGVHTPEFEFEQQHANVEAAALRFGLRYPIAQDNRYATWDAFDNRFWPAKYLLTPDRGLVYQHFGEGDYEETEAAIRAALERTGDTLDAVPPIEMVEPPLGGDASRQTAELYGGYRRNYSSRGGFAGQDEYYLEPDTSRTYLDPGKREPNRWYLQGEWFNSPEAIVHNRRTERFEDYIALRFRARSANVVIQPEGHQPFEVVAELDGRPLRPAEFGSDISVNADGRTVLRVDGGRLYQVVHLEAFGEHDLVLRANSSSFAVYAFTFGAYTEGP